MSSIEKYGDHSLNPVVADFEEITRGLDTPLSLWTPPVEFDITSVADRQEIARRVADGRITRKIDNLDAIANGLFEMYHPDKEDDKSERDDFVDRMRAESLDETTWFAFDDGKLIRYPSEAAYFEARTFRNHDIDTKEESAILRRSTHVVGGGSVGSHIAWRLVQGGIGDTMVIADDDTFDLSNLNRVEAGMEDLDTYKIDHLARRISKKDPYIRLRAMRGRLTRDNLREIADEFNPDIYYDAVDNMFAKAAIREVAFGRAAVVMATDLGRKSLVDVEMPDGKTKPFNGRINEETYQRLLAGDMSDEELNKVMVRIVGLRHVSARMLGSIMDIGTRLGGFPQPDATAAAGGALAAQAATGILLDRGMKSGRYVHSPEKVLGLKSPTSRIEAIKTVGRFVQHGRKAKANQKDQVQTAA